MTNPKESSEEKPSSEQPQEEGESSNQNVPRPQGGTAQNWTNLTQSQKSDEGDNVKSTQCGDQEKLGQNKTDVTQTEGDSETKGNGGDNVKGPNGCDPESDETNVTQTEGEGETEKSQGGNQETTIATAGIGGSSSSALLSGRKRGRNSDVGSSSGSNPRKKGELEVPGCAPTCYVCNRPFASWKAVFGHLRAHRRLTPGAFPPPIFTPEGSPERKNGDQVLKEQLAPTLLNLARETMEKMSQDQTNTTVTEGVASSSRRGLDIDLNEPRTSVLLDPDAPGTSVQVGLNAPSPPEKEDADDDQN